VEAELALRVQPAQARDKLASEDPAEHFHAQEEAVPGSNPAAVVHSQSASRNDTVNMRVKQQLLIPAMQHAEETDLRAEVFRVARDGEQSLRAGTKQQIVDFTFVPQRQRRELVRQSENDVRVAGRQQLAAACFQPAVARVGLALGAVPVAAGNGDLSITCLMGSLF